MIQLLPYLLLPVFGAAGYGLKWFLDKEKLSKLTSIGVWLGTLPQKSEHSVRRDAILLKADIEKL